jgi:hypothetical protein
MANYPFRSNNRSVAALETCIDLRDEDFSIFFTISSVSTHIAVGIAAGGSIDSVDAEQRSF